MIRSTLARAARAAALVITRGTLTKADDTTKLQTLSVEGLYGEKHDGIEHWHPYGFFSVPLAPTGDGSGQQAEVLLVRLGGANSHPVALAVADRRSRPTSGQPGEVGIHDDQNQMVHLTRDGIVITSPTGKTVTLKVGGVTMAVSSSGVAITGGQVTHNGKDIGDTHKHGGIERGGALTDPPA